MKRIIFLAPVTSSAGLTTVALGLVRALDQQGVRVGFFKPVAQNDDPQASLEKSTYFLRATTPLTTPDPIPLAEVERLLANGQLDELMAKVISLFQTVEDSAEVIVVEGLVPAKGAAASFAQLNLDLARTLSAEVVLVASAAGKSREEFLQNVEGGIRFYGSLGSARVLGCIANRLPQPVGVSWEEVRQEWQQVRPVEQRLPFAWVGLIPENQELIQARTADVARYLQAEVLHPGEMEQRRVKTITVLARTVPNLVYTFRPGSLLVTPADRTDVITAVAMAALNHIPLAGLVLTADLKVDAGIMNLCRPGWETGLPVLQVRLDSYEAAALLLKMSTEVPVDDLERIKGAMDFVARHIEIDWIKQLTATAVEMRMSPAAFCYLLTERARRVSRRILLPEGEEPRTIKAAVLCQQRGIARCALLGNPEEIRRVAQGLGVELPDEIEIIDANAVRARYVGPMMELRRGKNLNEQAAQSQLEDNVVLGTVMLALGEADGLVSGAIHSSANTVRPALQMIKTRPGAKVVSSIFFMCLQDQVVVYGDCAVNTDPDAEMLADIAIQSADSAIQFGIPARVAMISYSTGESGSGADVDKVRAATQLAQSKRPDLLIDGPLQYDAAAIAEVAATKAPGSAVAGRATVFIFPDLNTGNTTYKAVQRSANVISIGPMLQGLKRPVNDLSRGALVEDIIYTIALTAIQAEHNVEITL
jgi:phosphate acetyltransferase